MSIPPDPGSPGPSGESKGVAVTNWLLMKATGFIEKRASRRGFLIGSTLAGSAVAASGIDFVTRPGSAYAQVAGCPPGSFCADGYTEFCCALVEGGLNTCPPGSFAGGWWRADHSSFCGGGTRYYIDCMQNCCGPGIGGGFCAGCTECRCAYGCGTRKVYCNYFRYGQCHQEISVSGPIACRVVTCVPPYLIDEFACSPAAAVDNSTAEHAGHCLPPAPPPSPPQMAALLPSSAAAASPLPGLTTVLVRGADGALWFTDYDGAVHAWSSLGGSVTSGVSAVSGNGVTTVVVRGGDNAIHARTRVANGAWSDYVSLGGQGRSDPIALADGSGVHVFVRGNDGQCYANHSPSPGVWTGWVALGGLLTSEPAVAVNSAGMVMVVRGLDNALYLNRAGFGWTGFSPLGGAATSNPICVADANGFSAFVRGADNSIFHCRIPNSGAPAPWVSLGGGATSDPVAVVDGLGIHVVVRGNDHAVWRRTLTTDWVSLGGGASADPVAVADAGNGTQVIARGNDAATYRTTLAGGGWESLIGSSAPVRARP